MAAAESVTLRYWAAARQAAGTGEERYESVPTLADLLDLARGAHPDGELSRVLSVCTFLVDGQPVGRRPHADVPLVPGSAVEARPPFAGGRGAAGPAGMRPAAPTVASS